MLPPVRIEPSTSDSKSNTPRFGQTWQVLLKFLFMYYLIFGLG